MSSRLRLPSTTLLSVLAALTAWLTMTTWSGFSEAPEDFLVPLAIGCALVAVTGTLLRSVRLHPVLVVLGQLAVIGLWLNHRFAADAAILGWLPTADSIRDSIDVLRASSDAAQSYAAPVPASIPTFPPILITLGSGLAVLVDLLACGARRVPLAGLPLLAMYTAPVSMLDAGVPWWKFALIAVAFLALLAGEEAGRLAHWGRDLGLGERRRSWQAAPNRTVWPSARKIGLTATAMAVVVPLFVPTITGGVLTGIGSGAGPGDGDVQLDNPMLDVKRNLERGADVPWIDVVTDDPNPSYLRMSVLDQFNGFVWKPSDRDVPISHRIDGDLPLPPGLEPDVRTARRQYSVQTSEDYRSRWLPLPYPTLSLNIAGDWRYDPSTMDVINAAEGKNAADITYSLAALDVQPTAEDLVDGSGTVPNEIFTRYTHVDSRVDDWVGELAQEVTAKGSNKAERAVLLQDWFAEEHTDPSQGKSFEYSLANSRIGSAAEDLDDFLRNTRTGYCEQFATSMALMARTLDIPARVVVGFLRPDPIGGPGSDTYRYSSYDLHAWPELYFGGVGWVRFEPTPSSRGGTAPPEYTDDLREATLPTETSTATTTAPPTTSTGNTAGPTERPLGEEPLPVDGTAADGGRPWLTIGLVVLIVLAALVCLPRALRVWIRRRRWASAQTALEQAEAAWAELRDSFVDHRLPWNEQDTVRQRSRAIVPLFRRRPGPGEEHLARVITSNPEAEAALDRILHYVERSRYARTVPEVDDIRRDVELCVESVRLGLDPDVRRKATWLPASLVKRSQSGPVHDSGLAALDEPSLTH